MLLSNGNGIENEDTKLVKAQEKSKSIFVKIMDTPKKFVKKIRKFSEDVIHS